MLSLQKRSLQQRVAPMFCWRKVWQNFWDPSFEPCWLVSWSLLEGWTFLNFMKLFIPYLPPSSEKRDTAVGVGSIHDWSGHARLWHRMFWCNWSGHARLWHRVTGCCLYNDVQSAEIPPFMAAASLKMEKLTRVGSICNWLGCARFSRRVTGWLCLNTQSAYVLSLLVAAYLNMGTQLYLLGLDMSGFGAEQLADCAVNCMMLSLLKCSHWLLQLTGSWTHSCICWIWICQTSAQSSWLTAINFMMLSLLKYSHWLLQVTWRWTRCCMFGIST